MLFTAEVRRWSAGGRAGGGLRGPGGAPGGGHRDHPRGVRGGPAQEGAAPTHHHRARGLPAGRTVYVSCHSRLKYL